VKAAFTPSPPPNSVTVCHFERSEKSITLLSFYKILSRTLLVNYLVFIPKRALHSMQGSIIFTTTVQPVTVQPVTGKPVTRHRLTRNSLAFHLQSLPSINFSAFVRSIIQSSNHPIIQSFNHPLIHSSTIQPVTHFLLSRR